MQGLSELSSLFGFAAVVISVAVGVGTLRQRAKEPDEKKWRDLEKWKESVDEKLDRDYRSINTADKRISRADRRIDRHQDFERLMLRSMLGILEHMSEGNHVEKLQEISKQISEYLIGDCHRDIGDDA